MGKRGFFVLWKSWNFCILTSLHQYILFTPVQVYFTGLASCVVVFFSLHGLIPTTRIGIRQRNGIYQSLIPPLRDFGSMAIDIQFRIFPPAGIFRIFTPAGMQRRASDDGSDEAARDISWSHKPWSRERSCIVCDVNYFRQKKTTSQKTWKGEARTGKGWPRQHWQGESSFLPSPSRLPPCVLGIIS